METTPNDPVSSWKKGNVTVLFVTILVLGLGEELWTRFIPKYLEFLGAGAWMIAVYGTLKDFLEASYKYPGGWFTDRFGGKPSLIVFAAIALAGYLIYWLSPGWEWILVGTFLVMAWSSLILPAIFSIIGDHLPPSRRAMGFGIQSILKRIPVIVAPPLGGWLIFRYGLTSGLRTGFFISILLALVSIWIAVRFYTSRPATAADPARMTEIWRSLNPNLKKLLVADCLARWAEGIPKVFIVLFAIDVLRIGPVQFGWLTSVEMLTAILFYIPIARLADRMNRKPLVAATFLFFALFPLVLAGAEHSGLPVLVMASAAFFFAGLRELGEPARKALIVDLTGENFRGRAVGLYYTLRGVITFPASLLGGWLWTVRSDLPFYTAFGVGILGFVFYLIWGSAEGNTAEKGAV